MSRRVAVVDYGMGNLRSVSQAVVHAAQGQGFEVDITCDPAVIRAARATCTNRLATFQQHNKLGPYFDPT